MRRAILILLCGLMVSSCALAQEELFAWTFRLGGDGVMQPRDMALAAAGGVFIVGETDSEEGGLDSGYGLLDAFVLRVDAEGNLLWKNRYGGSGDDTFSHVLETFDGGCIAMGTSNSSDGNTRSPRGELDAFLIRISPEGETLWAKNLGGSQDDELLDIVLTEEGMFLVCGRTKSRNGDLRANNGEWDAWVALLSAEDGRPVWVDRYGDQGNDKYTKIVLTADGFLVIGEYGQLMATGDDKEPLYEGKPIAMLYGEDGSRIWSEPMVLGGNDMNQLLAVAETDVGWLMVGETDSRSALMPSALGGTDIWALFLRQSGTVQRQQRYGGSGDERMHSVYSATSGRYIILGTTDSNDGNVVGNHGAQDVWVVCVSPAGVLEWQQTLGGSANSIPAGLIHTRDGGYLVAGSTLARDMDIGHHTSVRTGFLAKLFSNGNLLWVELVGGTEECSLLDIRASQEGAYVLGSISAYRNGVFVEDVFLARLSEAYYLAEE